jgi:type VI secretion system protein ImpM
MMFAHGYFGKVPHSCDFVFRGLPALAADALADVTCAWTAACRNANQSDWEDTCLRSPVWRFAVGAGVFGEARWIGLIAGSTDKVGRTFPFAVMVSSDINPISWQPLRYLNAMLDPVENCMLAFIRGETGSDEMLAASRAAGQSLKDRSGGARQMDGNNRVIIPRAEHRAVCFSEALAEPNQFAAAYGWPVAHCPGGDAPLCLWWHDGSAERCSDLCITRGAPTIENAAPFFLGDWKRHGWVPISPTEYGYPPASKRELPHDEQ